MYYISIISCNILFETKEQLLRVIKTFKADEGLKQNIETLEIYLETKFQFNDK